MEECELCGKKISTIYIAEIEGVEFRLCAACANGKKVLRVEREGSKEDKIKATKSKIEIKKSISREDMELVDNYSKVIKEARERMKIPVKVLAEMLNEKEKLLLHIEEGKMKPTLKLIDKLEKTLNIKLLKIPEDLQNGGSKKSNDEVTIGDFLNNKKEE
ncbi:MAG: multiprotein bridging factor aMBF1 [Candidatus Micrarchaeia archaeon]